MEEHRHYDRNNVDHTAYVNNVLPLTAASKVLITMIWNLTENKVLI